MSNSKPSILHRGWSVFGKLVTGTRKGPSRDRARQLKKFQKHIDVRFTDLSLLEQALTHRSYSHVTAQTRNDSNERMEFLGDSVLGLAVSQFLYLQFPDRSEGALSKMKSLLVSKKILSQVSREIGLGEFMLLSGEESEMGGRDRASILADSFESVIGAIYLDQGYRSANKFIRVFLLGQIVEILKDEEHTNYKSLLQEYVQSRRLSHPIYRVHAEAGPEHEKEFAIEVVVKGEVWGTGSGKSKKDAEQNAARAAMEMRLKKDASRKSRTTRPRVGAETVGKASAPRARGEHGIHASREKHRAKRRTQDHKAARGEVETKAKAAGGRRRGARRTEAGAASAGASKEAAPRERATSSRRRTSQGTADSSREKGSQERPARSSGSREKAGREAPARATRERAPREPEREKPAREGSAREKPAREKSAREGSAREGSAREKSAREGSTREKSAREGSAREKSAREGSAREKSAREKPEREKPTRDEPKAESPAPVRPESAERREEPKESPSAAPSAREEPAAEEKSSFRRRRRRSAPPGRR